MVGRTVKSSRVAIILLLMGAIFAAGAISIPTMTHNTLDGLQGGQTGQYYHLTEANYTSISNWDTAYGWGDHSAAGYLNEDGSVDLTENWIIATESIQLSAGNLTAVQLYAGVPGTKGYLWLMDNTSGDYLQIGAVDNAYNANRTLIIDLGNADRTLTLAGNVVIDQDYSTTGSPSFTSVISGSYVIGDNTLDTTEWAVLDGIGANQVIDWTSCANDFNNITGTALLGTTTIKPNADEEGLTVWGYTRPTNDNIKIFIDGTTEVINPSHTMYIRVGATDVMSFATSGVGFFNDKSFSLGDSPNARASFEWDTTQTPDTFLLGLSSGATPSRSMIICDLNDMDFDFAHASADDPTLFIHSENPSTDEWISFTHNQTDGVIAVGTGVIKLDGDAIISGTLNAKKVIEAHTSNDTLTAAESGSVHTNLGATGAVTLTLPWVSVPAGTVFTFAVQDAQELRIDPYTATIRDDSGQTADKYKSADAVGECVTLVADENGDWVVVSKHGTWTEEP